MNFLSTGRPGNLVSFLVPGVFVLFNIGIGVYYLCPGAFTELKQSATPYLKDSNSLVLAVSFVVLCFAYLIGVVLRLFKATFVDNLSGWLMRTFKMDDNIEGVSLGEDHFPYITYLKVRISANYPPTATEFFHRYWLPQAREKTNRGFFNHCKVTLFAIDSKASPEIYAAEALTRYLSGTFYGLVFSVVLLAVVTVVTLWHRQAIPAFVATIGLSYLAASIFILKHFRFIRLKEVETVFSATFAHQDSLPFHGTPATAPKRHVLAIPLREVEQHLSANQRQDIKIVVAHLMNPALFERLKARHKTLKEEDRLDTIQWTHSSPDEPNKVCEAREFNTDGRPEHAGPFAVSFANASADQTEHWHADHTEIYYSEHGIKGTYILPGEEDAKRIALDAGGAIVFGPGVKHRVKLKGMTIVVEVPAVESDREEMSKSNT